MSAISDSRPWFRGCRRAFPLLRAVAGIVAVLAFLGTGGCAKKVFEVPVPPAGDGRPRIIQHRVAEGETLGLIADNYYGDPGKAEQIGRANGLADPDRVLPGSVLRLEFADREWDSARRRAAALEPFNRGVDLLARDRLGEAERQFRLATDTAPELLGARYNLALVLLKRGRSTEALVLLEELTELRPADADFRFARGNALFQLARFPEAAEQFRLVLAKAPDHLRAGFSLARSLQEGGRPSEARAAWERYLELDGDSSWAEAARGHLRKLNDAGRR